MDFNTSTANSNLNSPCRNGNTRRQFLGATTAPCTHLGLSELVRMCQSDVVTSYYDATASPGDYWPLLYNRVRIRKCNVCNVNKHYIPTRGVLFLCCHVQHVACSMLIEPKMSSGGRRAAEKSSCAHTYKMPDSRM